MSDQRRLGERGLELATERLRAGVHRPDPESYLVPLAEVLAWTYSLHEWHKRLDKSVFFARAKGRTEGRTLLAVVWARGAVAHELTDVTRVVMDLSTSAIPGRAVPGRMILGSVGTRRLRWVDQEDVPTKACRHGRHTMYSELVEGRPLLDPVEEARSYLLSL